MQLNPMSEIRAIAEACRRECLPASARLLWRVLFDCANDRQKWNADTNTYDWPDDFFPIDNAELTATSALEKRALLEARNRLNTCLLAMWILKPSTPMFLRDWQIMVRISRSAAAESTPTMSKSHW